MHLKKIYFKEINEFCMYIPKKKKQQEQAKHLSINHEREKIAFGVKRRVDHEKSTEYQMHCMVYSIRYAAHTHTYILSAFSLCIFLKELISSGSKQQTTNSIRLFSVLRFLHPYIKRMYEIYII